MFEKPEVLYGEVQGVVGYWYPEMDMDIWLKPILEKARLWDKWKPVTCIELVDKIEAISKWINKHPKCIRGRLKLKELENILGGES